MAKKVLVIMSENFFDPKKENNHLLSTREIISNNGKIPVEIYFHNKKTDNPKKLKAEIAKNPHAILFYGCGKATVKKVTSRMCNSIKDKVSIFSYNSEHELSGIKKINTISDIRKFLTTD